MSEHESVYLHSSRWDELLVSGADGMPPLRFSEYRGAFWLAEQSTMKLVNVGNKKLAALGVWTAQVRGTSYYEHAVGASNLWPGVVVELVREPENAHDKNAIAVHASAGCIGYVNKGMAARLAKVLDSGSVLEAVLVSAEPWKLVAAEPSIVRHLRGR